MEIWIVTIILCLTLVLLITEQIPIDLTAMGIMVALLATGILSAQEAVNGFANPAVVTIGAMFVISRALMRTGALGFVGERIIAFSKGNAHRIMTMSLLVVAFASAFINNTPVVVLYISILMTVCCEYGLSPSKFMIPISYASILAGTCTLIGTSTNILVSDLSFANGYGAIAMFELASLGVPIALLGLGFLYFTAPRVMPSHMAPICELRDSEDRKYLAELLVPKESRLIGHRPMAFLADGYPSLEVFEVVREPYILFPEGD
jgi:Na+/H+ antiporter NhaD/arsenite permease-like protein